MKLNIQALIDKVSWLKFKAIAAVKGLTKDQAVDEAIKDWNEKNKGVLG